MKILFLRLTVTIIGVNRNFDQNRKNIAADDKSSFKETLNANVIYNNYIAPSLLLLYIALLVTVIVNI